MLTRVLRWGVGVAGWIAFVPQAWATGPHQAKVESIEGAKTVLLQRGIALREIAPGDPIEFGERIRTDGNTTVTIAYSDGSHLTVLPNSDLEIENPQGAVQSNELRSGLVRGKVEKAPAEGAAGGGASAPASTKPIKFVIRTKTAVMGVRGTEFVAGFNAASGLAQFNTLEGTVDVATSPAELMGGQGVAVASGQYIQATEAGLSAVQSFQTSSFLGGLGSMASALGSAASATGSVVSSSSSSDRKEVEARTPPPVPPAPPPNPPVAPVPPPPPPAVVQQKLEAEDKDRPKLHLAAFALGGFYGQNPNPSSASGIPYYRAFEITWTPYIPLPILNFLYVRGSFGATLFENYSLNNAFLIHEYQAFAGTTLLSPLYAEVGGGEQIWRNDNIDSAILSANAGLIVSPNGRLNRIFVGVSKFFAGSGSLEARAGIGFTIF
jgi:hypothetical protein